MLFLAGLVLMIVGIALVLLADKICTSGGCVAHVRDTAMPTICCGLGMLAVHVAMEGSVLG